MSRIVKAKLVKPDEADALFGPKIPKKHHGKQVSGHLPDKKEAKRLAKSKGADKIIPGLVVQEGGISSYYTPCWISYKGDKYVGVVTQDYVGLGGGPSPIRFSKASERDTVKLK